MRGPLDPTTRIYVPTSSPRRVACRVANEVQLRCTKGGIHGPGYSGPRSSHRVRARRGREAPDAWHASTVHRRGLRNGRLPDACGRLRGGRAPGDSGRVHMHLQQDEVLFVHRGILDVLLGDQTYRAAAGATVFIPRRTWVSFRTAGVDTAGFFFVFNAPGFEKCLRALSAPSGEQFAPLSRDEIERVSQECHYRLKAR